MCFNESKSKQVVGMRLITVIMTGLLLGAEVRVMQAKKVGYLGISIASAAVFLLGVGFFFLAGSIFEDNSDKDVSTPGNGVGASLLGGPPR